MQVKDGFVLRKAGKKYIVVPTGDVSREFNGMLRMSEAGAFLFKALMEGTTAEALAEAAAAKFGVEPEQARLDVDDFVRKLTEANLMK